MLAAVDLGSNSFRLEIGRVEGDLIFPHDDIKVSVRLAAGLNAAKWLDAAAMTRGWQALAQFAERLRGFAPECVRAVATNTLRVAKNADIFIAQGEQILGFSIEVIAGREEARLIYLGVAHSVGNPHRQNLVFDIGGGSTEFIIGHGFTPQWLESLYMGCVGYTKRFFPDGEATEKRFTSAYMAAREELEAIASSYRRIGWEQVFVSSGSARALSEVAAGLGLTDGTITLPALQALRQVVLDAKTPARLMKLPGMRADRADVFAAGLAIMLASFEALGLTAAQYAEGAMRLGVLYDLLGRQHDDDVRERTVARFMERFGVDAEQAARVERTALALVEALSPQWQDPHAPLRRLLTWAARLHEIGLFVAHSSYHKHGAYILAQADMPGFSRSDQARLARLVLGHRGKLARLDALPRETPEWDALFALRIAVILHRSRRAEGLPAVTATRHGAGYALHLPPDFVLRFPLTAAALEHEVAHWQQAGKSLRLEYQG